MDIQDDIPRYRKKSTSKPPKKSKHKHLREPCIIEYPENWHTKEHLCGDGRHTSIGTYCPICGKIGDITDWERWYQKEPVHVGIYILAQHAPTNEGKRELDPETRTLPTFFVDSPFAKFVELNKE